MPNTKLTMDVKYKLDLLINSVRQTHEKNSTEKTKDAIGQVLKACSNTCLEKGVSVKGMKNMLHMSSLWEVKHACTYVMENLPDPYGSNNISFDTKERNDKFKCELNFMIKGVENRIKSEWAIFNACEQESAATGRVNYNFRNQLMERLRDPIDSNVRGFIKNGVLETNL
ncbi:hypothetical protein [Chromobacterium sinusclupearum]|uniref:hypothetical protein n=1 Tax=Chromobacterium sinusclupearum TaxID=2077146 RepID=UPI0011AF7F80|nr:hypothetical protein [Chromobacterium sinusclupearum]